MKHLIFLIVFALSEVCFAKAKTFAEIAKWLDQKIPLSKASASGAGRIKDFEKRFTNVPREHVVNHRNLKMLYTPSSSGTGGTIETVALEADGTVITTSYKADDPKVKPYYFSLGHNGMNRRYLTARGDLVATQNYIVDEINGNPMRIQMSEVLQSRAGRSEVLRSSDRTLKIGLFDQQNANLVDPAYVFTLPNNFQGNIIDFNFDLAADAKTGTLSVFTSFNGKNVSENRYLVEINKDGKKGLSFVPNGFESLTNERIDELGFLAKRTVLEAAKPASGANRGVRIAK